MPSKYSWMQHWYLSCDREAHLYCSTVVWQGIFVVNTSQGRRPCNELWSMSTGVIMQLPMSAIERVWISPLQLLSDSLKWQSGQSCMWLDRSWVCFPFVTNWCSAFKWRSVNRHSCERALSCWLICPFPQELLMIWSCNHHFDRYCAI
jgi:hypothetical protein